MIHIHTYYAFNQALSIFRVQGQVDARTLLSFARQVQSANSMSTMHMWDFTHGALCFAQDEGGRLLHNRPASAQEIACIQTALVCPNELDHGLFRMVSTFGQLWRFPRQIRAFRCMRAAQRWLGACRLCHTRHPERSNLECASRCTRA